MNSLTPKIKQLAKELEVELIAIRRHIHANPELSFQEFNTAKYISEKLTAHNISHTTGIAGTGIVGLIEGKNPSKKIIALRADMDALPIQEKNTVEYCSKVDGVMHACGHDVHCTCLLGAAIILNTLKTEFEGTIKLIFQPGEEKLPGGASIMIKEGVLENPKPELIIGQHVQPNMEVGKLGFKSGMYMASTDEIYLKIIGKGGHAAMPDSYNNPLLIASEVLLALETEFKTSLHYPTVLAFGKITGNGATNVIPDEVNIEGTFRTMNEDWRAEAHQKIEQLISTVAKKRNANFELNIIKGYPFLVNDDKVTQRAINAASDYIGKENIIDLPIRMTAEDFAWYSQQIPACFYRLGTGASTNVHTNTFNIDETSLAIGAGNMAAIAVGCLG